MDFWARLDNLIEFKNLTRKEVAANAKFSYSSFTNGRKRESVPAADVALRIAKVLGVSVEYLLEGELPTIKDDKDLLELIKIYRRISPRDKSVLFALAKKLDE
ncbi:MAG: helix-turn-helix transcriptional regulator [Treponema sp.]|nr:helix-turn-helix transcriptional regulator [Treponema sp.]